MEKTETSKFIQIQIDEHKDLDKVTAIAMPAGTGKSSFIKKLITESDEAMIVVTDRIKQVKNYFTITDDEGETVELKTHRAIYLIADNLKETMPIVEYTPIVVMTMARYFALSLKEIIDLSYWKGGRRDKVIIDEMPPIIEQPQIDMETLNDIHSALYQGIDDEANQREKDWAVEQWEHFRERLEVQMNQYETQYGATRDQFYLWFTLAGKSITDNDDDDRFFSFVRTNEKRILRYGSKKNRNIMASLRYVELLRDNGALFSCRKKTTGEYIKSFTVMNNNLFRLVHLIDETNMGMKVYILDGTADIAPCYQLKGIEVIPCREYYRDLSNLEINIFDINTSKYALTRKENEDEMFEIKRRIPSDSLVIAYMDYINLFRDCVDNPDRQLAYFGNIRGDNDYNQMTKVCQIGLNRYPPAFYLMLDREINREYYDSLFSLPTDEYIDRLGRIIQNHCKKSDDAADRATAQRIYETMEKHLLQDVVQNIFRTRIRNYADNTPVEAKLFFDFKQHSQMVTFMREMLEPHKAKIDYHGKPKALQLKATQERKPPKGKSKTSAQKILEYLNRLNHGSTFRFSELLQATGLTKAQFDHAKQKNKALSNELQSMQTGKRGYYRKP